MSCKLEAQGYKDILREVDGFYGPQKIKVFSGESPGFDGLLSAIRTDEVGGEPFRKNLARLAVIMADEWQKNIPLAATDHQELLIGISIPRGGTPMGTGLKEALSTYPHFESNDGKNKDTTKPLLPLDFPHQPIEHVIIGDTVIGTGHTILKTIEEINRVARVRFFHIFSAVASGYGISEILKAQPYGLRICAGCIEEKTKWVVKDGKPVLFVAGIGDAGDLVSR